MTMRLPVTKQYIAARDPHVWPGFSPSSDLDAIGTNLYAWCANSPVTRVDPSGMWSFRDLGARFLGAVGAAIGAMADTAVGFVMGVAGIGGFSGGGYSGGGNGFSGHRAGRRFAQAAAAAKPAPKLAGPNGKFALDPAKAAPWEKSFLNTSAGGAFYGLTGTFSFASQVGHFKTRNQVIMDETFRADGVIDPDDKDQGGKKVGEYIHWYDANIEAPILMGAGISGMGSALALEGGCISAGAGVGGIACAPASAGLFSGSYAFAYANYNLWEGSSTHKAASWVWNNLP